MAPVVGAILYDFYGIRAAYITQAGVYCLALAVLLILGFWWRCSKHRQRFSKTLPCSTMQTSNHGGNSYNSSANVELGPLRAGSTTSICTAGTAVQQALHGSTVSVAILRYAAEPSLSCCNSCDYDDMVQDARNTSSSRRNSSSKTRSSSSSRRNTSSSSRTGSSSSGKHSLLQSRSHHSIKAANATGDEQGGCMQASASSQDKSKLEEALQDQEQSSNQYQHQQQQQKNLELPKPISQIKAEHSNSSSSSWMVREQPNAPVFTTAGSPPAPAAAGVIVEDAGSPLVTPMKLNERKPTVWRIILQGFVIGECGQAMLAQLLRTALNVLIPLAMSNTPTWLVGMVFLGEAVFAVLSPFILDFILARYPGMGTKGILLGSVLVKGVSASITLLFYMSIPGAMACMAVLGSAHSLIEAIVFKRVVDYVAGAEDPAVLNASMSAFSLFYVLGFTLGALIAGVPDQGNVLQQQLAAAAVAGVMVLYTEVYQLLLYKGYITCKPHSRRLK